MMKSYRNVIATTIALLSIGAMAQANSDVPVRKAKPTPLEIAAFWTPERRRSVVSRDVAIDIKTGAAFIRQADGTMAPVNFNSTSSNADGIADPTSSPSDQPTKNPTSPPTLSPSKKPTESPSTKTLTSAPTNAPTNEPSKKPTSSPSKKPTESPIKNPTTIPTLSPTPVPSDTDEPETLSALSWSDIESDDPVRRKLKSAGWSHSDGNLHVRDRRLQDEVSNGNVPSPTPPELQAVGRLFFCFDDVGCFVCSATVLTGNILATAAHCVYDVALGLGFANNVMFVPNQVDGEGDGSDQNCENDLYGCWFPDHGITTSRWASSGIPDGLNGDFGVMVIKTGNNSSHLSVNGTDDTPLDEFVCPFTLDFNQEAFVQSSEFGTAYGYPFNVDPEFRFCQGGVVERNFGPFIALWMEICTMTGGSSGGPWVPYSTRDIYSTVSFLLNDGDGNPLPGLGATRCYVDGTCQCVLDAAQNSTDNLIVNDVSCPLTRLESSGPVCTSDTASPTRKPTNFPTAQPTNASPTRKPTNIPTAQPTNKSTTSSPSKAPTVSSESSKPTHYPTKAPSGGSSRSSSSSKASKSKKSCSSINKEKKCKKECEWVDDECVEKTINCDEFVTKKKCKKYYPTCEWDLEGNVCTNSTTTTGVSANETVAVSPLTGKVVGHDDGLVTMITHNSGCTMANAPAFLGPALFALMWYS